MFPDQTKPTSSPPLSKTTLPSLCSVPAGFREGKCQNGVGCSGWRLQTGPLSAAWRRHARRGVGAWLTAATFASLTPRPWWNGRVFSRTLGRSTGGVSSPASLLGLWGLGFRSWYSLRWIPRSSPSLHPQVTIFESFCLFVLVQKGNSFVFSVLQEGFFPPSIHRSVALDQHLL